MRHNFRNQANLTGALTAVVWLTVATLVDAGSEQIQQPWALRPATSAVDVEPVDDPTDDPTDDPQDDPAVNRAADTAVDRTGDSAADPAVDPAVVPTTATCDAGCGSTCDECCGGECSGKDGCCAVCCPKMVTEEVKKKCWLVESKLVCVPAFRWPWECWRKSSSDDVCCSTGCDRCAAGPPPKGGYVRCINVLDSQEYTCEKCGYEWEVKCVRRGDRCCPCGESCCPGCGCSADEEFTDEDFQLMSTEEDEDLARPRPELLPDNAGIDVRCWRRSKRELDLLRR